ncbi:MAG: sel1 repeat family protein, partial [Alphaproteobacteria bacterium]
MARQIALGRTALAALMIAGSTASFVHADVLEGVRLYEAGDYAGAIREWQPYAAQDDPNALFNLAQVYRLGRGVPADLSVAENYYARAAKLGHVSAQGNLGTLYY